MQLRTASFHERMCDEMIDAYVDWREQSRGVWEAYQRWSAAPPEDQWLRFAAYLAALDQEQRACDVYWALIVRTADHLAPADAFTVDGRVGP